MSDAVKNIDNNINILKGLTDQLVSFTGERIDQAYESFDYEVRTLELTVKLRIARVEALLIGPIALMVQNSSYHILRAYYQASPGLAAIIIAIWGVIVAVYNIVKYIISIYQVVMALGLDDLLAEYWVWFAEARDKFRQFVTELSRTLGWGIDGFAHLLHAVQGVTSVVGGLTGKDYKWMQAAWIDKTGDVLEKVDMWSSVIQSNPGAIMEMLFQWESYDDVIQIKDWGKNLYGTIDTALGKGVAALQGLVGVANDLSAIQEGMPDVIRANIPVAIWDSLGFFEGMISDQILPRLYTVERTLATVESVFGLHSTKLSDLAKKLKYPGSNMLTIDDLPGYLKYAEEWAIDDVSSRQFADWTDAERAAMQPDLDRFEIIDNAAKSPLPELPFMDIESPARYALHGITADPQETWFVGGYKSPY